jgi:hypothetical protein
VLSSSDNESEILLYQRKEGDLERINNLWGVHMWAAFQIFLQCQTNAIILSWLYELFFFVMVY